MDSGRQQGSLVPQRLGVDDMYYGYRQQPYGPGNALVDILAAYIRKQRSDGAMDAAANYNKQIGALGNPQAEQVPVQEQSGADVAAQNAANQLMPSTQFGQQKNFGTNGSILDAATQYLNKDPRAVQGVQAADTSTPQTVSNPMQEYGFTGRTSAPLSYSDFQQKANDLRNSAMLSMTKKYGSENAQNALKMIDTTIADRTKQYTDEIDNKNRQALAGYLTSDNINTPQGLRQALWAATEYNHQAQQMGKPTIDTALLGKMIDAGKVSITAKNAGGTVEFYAVPKDGGQFSDGSYMKPIFSQQNSMTPDAQANLQERRYEHDNPSANAQLQAATSRYATDSRASSGGGGRGGSGNPAETQRKAAMSIVQAHNNWVKNNFGTDESEDPNWENVQKAYSVLSGLAGGGSSSDSSSSGGSSSDPVYNWIDEAYNHGYSKEQIQQALRDKGYGDSYDDSLWD